MDFKYRYVGDRGNPDWPSPIVFEVGSLAHIKELPQFLIENIELLYDTSGLNTHLGARPISFELSGGVRVSERSFWTLAIENNVDCELLIAKYVDAHLSKGGELALCSYLDVVGQEALYAYFDCLSKETEVMPSGEIIEGVVDCFIRFLKACDMAHETYQDEFLSRVLSKNWANTEQFVGLVCFRMFVGQNTLAILPHDRLRTYLTRSKVFKQVLDYLLHNEPEGCFVDILRLCAPVYGSDADATEDVLRYCREITPIDESQNVEKSMRRINVHRAMRDAELATTERFPPPLDTGLHEYDYNTRSWRSVI